MVQMLDSWSVEEREHSIAKMMLMDVDKSPKAIEGCSQGRRLLSNLKEPWIISNLYTRVPRDFQYIIYTSFMEIDDLINGFLS